MKVTISNIIEHTISVFDASLPFGTGANFLGVFDYTEDTGRLGWFATDNPLDPFTLCEHLLANGFVTKRSYGPGTYGHVDYFVTDAFRAELANQEAEAEAFAQQQASEIAAETAIPQHLVW